MHARLTILLSVICLGVQAQTSILSLSNYSNARFEGYGEVGSVAPPEYGFVAFQQNPALLSHFSQQAGGRFSYGIVDDYYYGAYYLDHIAGFFSINPRHVVGGSYKHMVLDLQHSIGDANTQSTTGDEYCINYIYSYAVTDALRLGVGISYIWYEVRSGQWYAYPQPHSTGISVKENTFSFDVGMEYMEQIPLDDRTTLLLSLGTVVNNIGPKVDYLDDMEVNKRSMPTIGRAGGLIGLNIKISKRIRLHPSFAYQVEKYLVEVDAPDFKRRLIYNHGAELRIEFGENFFIAARCGGVDNEIMDKLFTPVGFGINLYGFHIDFAMDAKGFGKHNLDLIGFINLGFRSKLKHE